MTTENDATGAIIDLFTKEQPGTLGKEVEDLFRSCLFEDSEIEGGKPKDGLEAVIAEGITRTVGFHPKRIAEAKEKVAGFIAKIAADEFLKSKGGGMSFLRLCDDREGSQWTNLHRTMEQLVQLAIGTGLGGYCAPRMLWMMMPGGMPYVWFEG